MIRCVRFRPDPAAVSPGQGLRWCPYRRGPTRPAGPWQPWGPPRPRPTRALAPLAGPGACAQWRRVRTAPVCGPLLRGCLCPRRGTPCGCGDPEHGRGVCLLSSRGHSTDRSNTRTAECKGTCCSRGWLATTSCCLFGGRNHTNQ